MPKAVQFKEYGGIDVLQVNEVERPTASAGEVLVQVKAAGTNPGEAAVREGFFHDTWPATFPSGQGTDFAGVVVEVGAGVTAAAVGDDVIGYTDDRASQAEFVAVEQAQITAKPAGLPWEVAGGLAIAGFTAWAAVDAVGLGAGEVVVVSGAAGGVGSLAVQLATKTGATVIGLASESNHAWLQSYGVLPVAYGEGVEDRIRAATPDGVDAFIDLYGSGYVALAVKLGVAPGRINTVIDFPAVQEYGVRSQGQASAQSAERLGELAEQLAAGALELPVAATFPLTEVQLAYRELEERHTHGKIVLIP